MIQAFSEKVEWESDLLYVCQNWPELVPEELRELAAIAVASHRELETAYEMLVEDSLV